MSLPSSRPDAFSVKVSSAVQKVRKTGITLAPEAGTQRLRDFIGKDVTEEEILSSARTAFGSGVNSIKLYFMLGLQNETEEDLQGIINLSRSILDLGKSINRRARLTVSLSTFIPKPHTPFERERQITIEETLASQRFIKDWLKDRSIEIRWHQPEMSFLEGVFSRGDLKLGEVLGKAFRS